MILEMAVVGNSLYTDTHAHVDTHTICLILQPFQTELSSKTKSYPLFTQQTVVKSNARYISCVGNYGFTLPLELSINQPPLPSFFGCLSAALFCLPTISLPSGLFHFYFILFVLFCFFILRFQFPFIFLPFP